MGTFAEKVSYLNETKLLIKDAIKNKGVAVEEDTPFREYANKIASISASADDIEPIVLTGDCQYACSGDLPSQYIALYGNTITTSGITIASNMFKKYKNATVPFEINMDNSTYRDMANMFMYSEIEVLPVINNAYPDGLSGWFQDCYYLRTIPEDWMDTWDFSRVYSYAYSSLDSMFQYCYSLRTVPAKILSKLHNDSVTNTYSKFYKNGFNYCYTLDGINGLAVDGATMTSNMFSNCFDNNRRLKELVFETNEDGSAKTANWKSQAINLYPLIGYGYNTSHSYAVGYNSGITADKEVYDDATYQALKDDPDWWSEDEAYSRYNHDSAVATINSLPDTSAYLATAGGTNTIKFTGAAGELTDGGAINTLTEEEIAVATAKGWTVTLV